MTKARDLFRAFFLYRRTIYSGCFNPAVIRGMFDAAGVEFTDENGGGVGVRLRKRTRLRPAK